MRLALGSAVLAVAMAAAAPAATAAQDCSFPNRQPAQADGRTQTMFVNDCGQVYEVGYRLEGNALHFPDGAVHAIKDADRETAETLLREAYGLVGERDALVRTKWAG